MVKRINAALVADKYIARDGGPPIHEREAKRARQRRLAAVVTLARYVAWQEPNQLWGGVRQKEALEALALVIGVPAKTINKIIRGV